MESADASGKRGPYARNPASETKKGGRVGKRSQGRCSGGGRKAEDRGGVHHAFLTSSACVKLIYPWMASTSDSGDSPEPAAAASSSGSSSMQFKVETKPRLRACDLRPQQ